MENMPKWITQQKHADLTRIYKGYELKLPGLQEEYAKAIAWKSTVEEIIEAKKQAIAKSKNLAEFKYLNSAREELKLVNTIANSIGREVADIKNNMFELNKWLLLPIKAGYV